MKITRRYSGSDGESHFEDVDLPMQDGVDPGEIRSQIFTAKNIIFRETNGQANVDWHHAPARQFVMWLTGQVEVAVGDGSKRVFSTGDIILAEDLTGHGHIMRSLNQGTRTSI